MLPLSLPRALDSITGALRLEMIEMVK